LDILFGDEPNRVVRTGFEPAIPHLDAYSTIGVSDLVRYPTRPLTILFIVLVVYLVFVLVISYAINHNGIAIISAFIVSIVLIV
jgi:hypothetical protein